MISFVEISSQDTKCQNTTLKGPCEIKKEINKVYFLATKFETGMWFILLQYSIILASFGSQASKSEENEIAGQSR